MKTAAEIDSKERVVRVFHRTRTAAWTHAPGERYRYWTDKGPQAGRGKDRFGWVEMRCDCPQIPDNRWDGESDDSARRRTPEPNRAAPTRLERAVGDG
jgi:hypothetical protein